MIQLFRCADDGLELIQTMDEHVGAVGRLMFASNCERLLSCSADRTVIIRERMVRTQDGEDLPAFVLSKVITLKASPVSMAVLPEDSDGLVLSTIDRQVHKFDIPSARHIHSFRAGDPETNDTAVVGSLTVASGTPGQCPRLLIGVSTTDKSIRVYDFERDVLLTREFGHTEGVSDVMLLQTGCSGSPTKGVKKTLVSTGLDGVIMTWNLSVEHFQSLQEVPQPPVDETPGKELTATRPPLRRILSRTELAGFVKPLDSTSPTPSPLRDPSPPRIKKKISRASLGGQLLKNNLDSPPSTVPTPPVPRRRSPTSPSQTDGRNGRENRSPSPPSPKASAPPKPIATRSSAASFRRGSVDSRARSSKTTGSSSTTTTPTTTNGNNSEFGSLNMSTEQVCRTLRAYRKKLGGSSDLPNTTSRDLERELDLTSRALSERATKQAQSSDSQETNNNNINKDKDKGATTTPATAPKRLTKRMPSTPNLRQARKERVHRANSLDASGEK